MSFTAGLILLMVTAMAAGFLLGALIFAKSKDGIMYFWTDVEDDKIYTQMQLDKPDIHELMNKKSITLDCIVVPPIKDDAMVESHETQGV